MAYAQRQGASYEQAIAYQVIDEYISLVRKQLMRDVNEEHCHHMVDMLLLAYELKHKIRTGQFQF